MMRSLRLLLAFLILISVHADTSECDCSQECETEAELAVHSVKREHESAINDLTQQLQQATEQIQTLGEEISQSKVDAKAAADNAELLAEANDLLDKAKSELDEVKARELAFQQEAEASLKELKEEIQDLINHKIKASELESFVSELQDDLKIHKHELSSTKSSLESELESHKAEIMTMRRQALSDKERLKELHDAATQTYVNTTLIYQDASIGASKAAVQIGAWWNQFLVAIHPHVVTVVDLYFEHVDPRVQEGLSFVRNQYDEHLKDTVDNEILPALEPVTKPAGEYLNQAHDMISMGLRQGCETLRLYLVLHDEDDKVSDAVVSWKAWFSEKLAWIGQNAEDVVTRVTYGLLIFFVIRILFLRKGRKPQLTLDENGIETPKKRVNFRKKGAAKLKSQ